MHCKSFFSVFAVPTVNTAAVAIAHTVTIAGGTLKHNIWSETK